MGEVRSFGRMPDGSEIEEVTIAAGDLTARIITFGAVIRDIRLAGIDFPLVLGFDRIEDYVAHSPYFGAVAGRYANRIAGGRLVIDGVVHQLALNEKGRTHLHGGPSGFGHRVWRLVGHDGSSVTLALTSEAGDEGYPGTVEVTCRYSVEAPSTIRMVAEATTDAPTVVNLAQHSYFNLDGSADILDHEVRIPALSYTPVDADLIPTGEVAPVAGTDFDFRDRRPVRRMVGGTRFAYDINYVVDRARAASPRPLASARSPKSGITLDIASTEPGVQFYDGASMNVPVPGLDGRRYGPSSGCCFEPQLFPDSPNQPAFPSALLRPGERYRQTSLFRFSRA